MLIEKRSLVQNGDIVTIKLLSGEEIVGKLVEQTAETVVLAKPVTITLQPVSEKQMGLSFMPVLGSVEPDVTLTLPISAMAIKPVATGANVKSSYIQTTTGLITTHGGLL
jgi:hypothetical protein